MLYVSGNVVCFEAMEQKKWFCGVVSCGFVLFYGFVGLWCILFPKIIENIDASIVSNFKTEIHNKLPEIYPKSMKKYIKSMQNRSQNDPKSIQMRPSSVFGAKS